MEIKLLAAVQLVEKTMSCVILKFWAWIIIAFCFVAATLIGAGVGLIANAYELHSTLPAQLGSVIGLCVCGYLAFKVRGTTMLPRRAGHVRVLVDQLNESVVFSGKEQVARYKDTVESYFGDAVKLAQVERKIRQGLTLVYFDRCRAERFSLGNRYLKALVNSGINFLIALPAEVILAYVIKTASQEPVELVAKKGVLLFAQEASAFSRPLWMVNVVMYVGLIFIYGVLLYPWAWVDGIVPFEMGLWVNVFAMIFAWVLKATFLESVMVGALIPVFLARVSGQEIKPEGIESFSQIEVLFGTEK
ncbi:MAG TPA: hypothetical protein EYQ55_07340 [Methylococcaceae bacterium]|jgi:F0F1-type ATP synthase assembly protein I|nr:hypothetical protein [Methylococcaceae bacterium]HIL41383.1 hypothetical protein [Methylococcales bacterium]